MDPALDQLYHLLSRQRASQQRAQETIDGLEIEKMELEQQNDELTERIASLKRLKADQGKIFQQLIQLEALQAMAEPPPPAGDPPRDRNGSKRSSDPDRESKHSRTSVLDRPDRDRVYNGTTNQHPTVPERIEEVSSVHQVPASCNSQKASISSNESPRSVPPVTNRNDLDRNGRPICQNFRKGHCTAGDACSASHNAVPFPYCHRLNYGRECKVKTCTYKHELYLGKYW